LAATATTLSEQIFQEMQAAHRAPHVLGSPTVPDVVAIESEE
jgi:hypothetical protein